MLSIGIDFGTSNSSVAVYDGRKVQLLALDPPARDPRVMRSLLYITRDGESIAGQRALEMYSEQNTGREVQLERRLIGEIDMTFAEVGTLHRHVFGLVDVNEPGRLFQSMKRFLADTAFTSTNVFGRQYKLEDLIATLAAKMIESAESALGEPIKRMVVGRPVHFSEEPEKDEAARERLAEAWRAAGLDEVTFLEEPIAAVHHFGVEHGVEDGALVLVFDFGGGTLDITVAEQEDSRPRVLATGGIPLGGDLLDSRLVEAEIAPCFGERARYRRTGLPAPAHLFTRLRSWQTIVELNRPELLELIRRARRGTDQPAELAAFETLVTRNYGFELFRAVEGAKIELSSAASAAVALNLDGISLHKGVARSDWEAVLSPQVRAAKDVVLSTVEAAGRDAEQVDYVVTTGGSSLIPAFRRMLHETLPNASLRETDTFTSVAAGLALWGAAARRSG
jgi:hypothetical chaperone protein